MGHICFECYDKGRIVKCNTNLTFPRNIISEIASNPIIVHSYESNCHPLKNNNFDILETKTVKVSEFQQPENLLKNINLLNRNKYVPENALFNLYDMNIITEQMKKICKIDNNGKKGSGFFAYINFPKEEWKIPVLITNNHILQMEDILPGKTISIFIYNEKFRMYLLIDASTKTYTNKDYDITLVEIKTKDVLDNLTNKFLDIDEDIYKIQSNQIDKYKKEKIYLIQYPDGEEVKQSDGLIKTVSIDDFSIEHTCKTTSGSSGGPILKLDNYKVIAVHRGKYKDYNTKSGVLIKGPIDEFIKKYSMNNIQKPKIKVVNINISNKKVQMNSLSQIIIKYKKIDLNQKRIKLFGNKFVENNRDKCFLGFEGKDYALQSYINLKANVNNVEIILKGIEKLTDIESMFEECNCLYSIDDISSWNTIKITNIKRLFSNCKLLKSIPDISYWNTINIRDMSHVFSGCESLMSLPNISKWDTSNVVNMCGMFFNCKALEQLPDISKWNTDKVQDISSMFFRCWQLKDLPNISLWNTINVTNMSQLFYECKSLMSLPDISLWETHNVNDMTSLFFGCKALNYFPDISKWNIQNCINIRGIFQACNNVTTLPDISKWKTFRVKDMSELFSGCSTLKFIPNISEWETSNVTNMKGMFFQCGQLMEVPDLTKWNIKNVNDMSYFFFECFSLSYSPNIHKWKIAHVNYKAHMFDGSKLSRPSSYQ